MCRFDSRRGRSDRDLQQTNYFASQSHYAINEAFSCRKKTEFLKRNDHILAPVGLRSIPLRHRRRLHVPKSMQKPQAFISLPIFKTSFPRPLRRDFKTPSACARKLDEPLRGIAVRNVSYWWANSQIALQNVSVDVAPGELAMIVGHNGCGKSTLLRVIRGLFEPPVGEIFLERPCGFVHQNPDIQILLPTIGADIAASIPNVNEITDYEAYRKVVQALEMVGLSPASDYIEISSYRLSGGQKQRAVVAAALAMKPASLLFDEVTASMDPVNKAELVARVRKIVTEKNIAALW